MRSISADRLDCLACFRCPLDLAHRFPEAPAQDDGLRPQDSIPGPAPRARRASRSQRPAQRAHRPRDPPAPGHRADLADPVRRRRAAGLGRPQAIRTSGPFHPRAGRRDQGAGLPAPGRDRGAAVALVVPGTGRRADSERDHRQHSASTFAMPSSGASLGSSSGGALRCGQTSLLSPTRPHCTWPPS